MYTKMLLWGFGLMNQQWFNLNLDAPSTAGLSTIRTIFTFDIY